MRLFITATLALALLAGPAADSALAACTTSKATAYDNPADADNNSGVNASQSIAQSFKVPSPITLNRATLYIAQFGATTDSITVEIRADAGGQPTGALLGTRTRTLTNTTPEFADFDFSSDAIKLAAGTTYYVVATNSAPSGDGYSWPVDSSSPTYADGGVFFTNSGTWSMSTPQQVQIFQVWGTVCTTNTRPPRKPHVPRAAVSGLAFSSKIFAAEGSGPSATNTRKKRAPRGTEVSYKLNEAASVRFTVTRRSKGRKVKRGNKTMCVRPTRKNFKRKRCIRFAPVNGSFIRTGVAGDNSFHFTGRMSGKKLKPGRYRLVATPTAGGKKGKPTFTAFRIVG